jgi:folate-binding protein YgfZ
MQRIAMSNLTPYAPPSFACFTLTGLDAEKFLQGQVTVDVADLTVQQRRPTAICDLKGRVQFGLWIMRLAADSFEITVSADLLDALRLHVRKYGAFSKMTPSTPSDAYPTVMKGQADFSADASLADPQAWQQAAICNGDAWINTQTQGLFQPQELRLHQRGGVDYDKGCYLGQEIVARLYFRAKPKAWLHRVAGTGDTPQAGQTLIEGVDVVNALATPDGWQALVIAKPAALEGSTFDGLDLPDGLNGEVGRVV